MAPFRLKTKSLEDTFLRAFLFVKLYHRGKKSCEVLTMFHKEKPDYHRCQYGFYTIDELVPRDHFLRQVESEVDFGFIYDLVEDTYSPDNGLPWRTRFDWPELHQSLSRGKAALADCAQSHGKARTAYLR